MWFIKVTFPRTENKTVYWFYTQPINGQENMREMFLSTDPLFAEAFAPVDVESYRRGAEIAYAGANAEAIECSSRRIIPADMRKVMGI